MVAITISEILERIEKFEQILTERYTELSQESEKEALHYFGPDWQWEIELNALFSPQNEDSHNNLQIP
jgi:hypothetical protein